MKLCRKTMSVALMLTLLLTSAFVGRESNVKAESIGSMVFFDNSSFGWDEVYIYTYGSVENAPWPGEKMTLQQDGLYKAVFPEDYVSEKVIFNNGKTSDYMNIQYPEVEGLPLVKGGSRLFTYDKQWVYYGEVDDLAYGYACMPNNVSEDNDSIQIRLGIRGANIGEYSVDGGPRVSYRDGTVISIGKGQIGNTLIKLQLFVTVDDIETTETYTFKKNYNVFEGEDVPMEVNFGANLSSGQKPGTELILSAEAYNCIGEVTYEFSVDGEAIPNSTENTAKWEPTKVGSYEISVKATDKEGNTVTSTKTFVVGNLKSSKEIGDLNGDGSVDIADARIVQQYCTKSIKLTQVELSLFDVNGDGKKDIGDSTAIQKMIAGLK